jgi:hypothetical protein
MEFPSVSLFLCHPHVTLYCILRESLSGNTILDSQVSKSDFGVSGNFRKAVLSSGKASSPLERSKLSSMCNFSFSLPRFGSRDRATFRSSFQAAFCGVCTLRASRGRMTMQHPERTVPPMPRPCPNEGGPSDGQIMTAGVFTRTVRDLRYAMDHLLAPSRMLSSPPIRSGA